VSTTLEPKPPDPTSPIRAQVDELAALLAVWRERDPSQAVSRAAAGNALDLTDALLRGIGELRSWLIDDIHEYDEAANAACDELLARLRRAHGITPLPDSEDRP
jgi:hypothetical protein